MVDHIYKANDMMCPICDIPCPGRCLYADIIGNIDIGVIVLDVQNEKLVFQNKFVKDIFKATLSQKEYNTLINLLLPGFDNDFSWEGFGKPQTTHFKDRLLGYTAYLIANNEFIWMLIRDITEKARLESMAEEVNITENIKYIFSSIRHELGNPINSIKMTLSVLKKNLGTYSGDTIRGYVDRSLTEISRVEYLLKSLKSFSMFENPIVQNVHLPDFLDRFLYLVTEDSEQFGIEIKTELSPEAEWGGADPRALQQVMLNLVTNAFDAVKEIDNPKIVISTLKRDDMIYIEVEDNGCGISADHQENLFKPFYTTKSNGTGLGLVITRRVLNSMNGQIKIKSEEDVGTTVTISIPEGVIENR